MDAANAAAQAKGFDYYQLASTKPGDVRYQDLNGDGHVDFEKDRTNIGSPIPNHYFGLNATLDYKGFDFNVFFQGTAGSQIYDGAYARLRGGTQVLNQLDYVLDRWQNEENPGNGIVPRAVIGDPAQNGRPSTLMVSSGNYMKVRQISLGYSFPKAFSKKSGFENIRVYSSAYNFFTFSNYEYGYDPEVGGDNLVRGVDNLGSFPNPKSLIFGVQLGF